MLEKGLTVIKLDKGNMQLYLSDLVELEQLVFLKRGHLYSTEEWGESHFLADLPGKFDLSYGIVKGNKLVAFLIVSEPFPGVCHVHRVAVHPKHPGNNIGRKLMLQVYESWKKMPEYRTITAIMRTDHKISLPFAKLLGAKVADKEYMTRQFQAMGRTDVQVFDNYFMDTYGISYALIHIDK